MRLIDADKLMNDVRNTITEQSNSIDWLNLINQQPTAYDVDKVVEQLNQNTHNMEICEEQFDMNRPYFKDVPYKMVKLEDAIEIAKVGVTDSR